MIFFYRISFSAPLPFYIPLLLAAFTPLRLELDSACLPPLWLLLSLLICSAGIDKSLPVRFQRSFGNPRFFFDHIRFCFSARSHAISSFHFVPSSCRHLRSGRLVVRPIACHRHYHRQTDLTSSSHCHHDRASVPSAAPSACFLRMVFPVSRVSTPLFISVCPARSRLQCSYAHARLRCTDQFCVRPT